MDLETFITEVYVEVDEWYKERIEPKKKGPGRKGQLSDSEVLTLTIVGQWQVGVPWRSERGLVRYVQRHLRGMFPQMIGRSSFNYRSRRLYGVLARLQTWLAAKGRLATDIYEAVDCVPVPAYSNGQGIREKGHWQTTATKGKGGYGWFIGHHVLATVTASGLVTGWLLGSGHINDRWLLEALLSMRAGFPQLVGPPPPIGRPERAIFPPVAHIGPWETVGQPGGPLLADQGFNGPRWQRHWWQQYRAQVITVPHSHYGGVVVWTKAEKRWLASWRQGVETTFALLTELFGFKRPGAHSLHGLYTRLTAKIVAYNFGILLNRRLGRPPRSLATLLC